MEENANRELGLSATTFFDISLPFTLPGDDGTETGRLWREKWIEFAKTRVPLRYLSVADADEDYRRFLRDKYADVSALNVLHQTQYSSFDEIVFPDEISSKGAVTSDIYGFVESDYVEPSELTIRSVRWSWAQFLKDRYGSVEAASRAHSIVHASWDDVEMPRRFPRHLSLVEQDMWKRFVVEVCPVDYIVDDFNVGEYRAYLDTFFGTIEKLNEAWGKSYKRFRDVRFPAGGAVEKGEEEALRSMLSEHLKSFIDIQLPEEASDELWREFVKTKFPTIEDFNEATKIYTDEESILRPMREVDWAHYAVNREFFKREYLVANYRAATGYMALHGRAFINTIILCGAMIVAALTVNPMCAYALSRFQLSMANSILLFLLATMAFPVAVTQIPNFLLLKELNLLNTYWALILPGLANGYSIFLLKGFFDSLPQELFEAGLIDGASEVQMFYRIALPLTKPVLAVIALGAFTFAYGQFMWAFIVCQNPRYWTIMVFLYDLQQDSAVPLVMASLVLASIPTLLVFLATQRVILRGIVVPQMK
jgi:multiple sugar transport system permease protein